MHRRFVCKRARVEVFRCGSRQYFMDSLADGFAPCRTNWFAVAVAGLLHGRKARGRLHERNLATRLAFVLLSAVELRFSPWNSLGNAIQWDRRTLSNRLLMAVMSGASWHFPMMSFSLFATSETVVAVGEIPRVTKICSEGL